MIDDETTEAEAPEQAPVEQVDGDVRAQEMLGDIRELEVFCNTRTWERVRRFLLAAIEHATESLLDAEKMRVIIGCQEAVKRYHELLDYIGQPVVAYMELAHEPLFKGKIPEFVWADGELLCGIGVFEADAPGQENEE